MEKQEVDLHSDNVKNSNKHGRAFHVYMIRKGVLVYSKMFTSYKKAEIKQQKLWNKYRVRGIYKRYKTRKTVVKLDFDKMTRIEKDIEYSRKIWDERKSNDGWY